MDIPLAWSPGKLVYRRLWRQGVAGDWIDDRDVSLDTELLDIPGLVVKNPGADTGLAVLSRVFEMRQVIRAGL